MITVNAVPSGGLVARATIIGSSSLPTVLLGRASRQMSPRAVRRHEVDRLGRDQLGGHARGRPRSRDPRRRRGSPSCRRGCPRARGARGRRRLYESVPSSEPFLGDTASEIAGALQRVDAQAVALRGRVGRTRRRRRARPSRRATYRASTSTSRLIRAPTRVPIEQRLLPRDRHQHHVEAIARRAVDRQRHAVDRDRAFGREERREHRRHLEVHANRVAERRLASDPAHAVDVPAHDVPAQPIAEAARALEMHRAARGDVAERRLRQRLGRRVAREAVRRGSSPRSGTRRRPRSTRRARGRATGTRRAARIPPARALDVPHRSDRFDETREHRQSCRARSALDPASDPHVAPQLPDAIPSRRKASDDRSWAASSARPRAAPRDRRGPEARRRSRRGRRGRPRGTPRGPCRRPPRGAASRRAGPAPGAGARDRRRAGRPASQSAPTRLSRERRASIRRRIGPVHDPRRPRRRVLDQLRAGRRAQRACRGRRGSDRGPSTCRTSSPRIVGEHRADADQHRVGAIAQAMRLAPRVLAGDPLASRRCASRCARRA